MTTQAIPETPSLEMPNVLVFSILDLSVSSDCHLSSPTNIQAAIPINGLCPNASIHLGLSRGLSAQHLCSLKGMCLHHNDNALHLPSTLPRGVSKHFANI